MDNPKPYKIKTEESSHWYRRDGTSAHTVPKKTSKTGEHRNTTITDARKMGLLPSVSECLGIIANEGLVRWKLGQVAITAAKVQRQVGEEDETFADRIILEALAYTKNAADFGTVMHAIIEDYLIHHHAPDFGLDDRIAEFWPPVQDWLDNNIEEVIQSEYSIVSDVGYAGRVDLKVQLRGDAFIFSTMSNSNFSGRCLLDFKTRNPDVNGKLVGHDKELWQLSAYSMGDPDTQSLDNALPIANLYINSNVPGDMRFNPYTAEEIKSGMLTFGSIVKTWQLIKNFDTSF